MTMLSRGICAIFQAFLVFFVLTYPYRERFRYSVPVTFSIIGILSICCMVPYAAVGFDFLKMGYLRILVSCIVLFLMSCASSFLTGIRLSVTVFSVYVIRNLTDSLMMMSRFIRIFYIPESAFSDAVVPLIYLPCLLLLAPILLRFITHNIKPNLNFFTPNAWRLLWAVPFTYYIFFRLFADADYIKEVSFWSFRSITLPFIWFFGTMVSHYIILKMINETAQIVALKEQLKYSELMSKVQIRESLSLQSNIDTTIKLRHDMRHHFVALNGYLELPDVPAAKNYLNTLVESLDSLELKPYCQNHVVNSLLNYYSERATYQQIKVTISVKIHEIFPIADTALCTILGNLFENALEACTRPNVIQPFISLNIGYAGSNMLVISIRNSYSREVRMQDGYFISSKRDGIGIGTSSIKYMAEQYEGICRFSHENNVFEVSVLLKGSGGNKGE